jgi:Tol biopolymer transport system component/DNA-binding winged helix-turn-helix (wHTH) protein
MKDLQEPGGVFAQIDLVSEADFALGSATVRPSLREVLVDGRRTALQPRVMQVLVALARAAGRVVSRDQLIASCWENLAVGEDAIQRCIAQLRRLAGDELRGIFVIDTVPRVGYRLVVAETAEISGTAGDAAPSEAPPLGPPRDDLLRTLSWIAGLTVLLAVAGAAVWRQFPVPWRVQSMQMVADGSKIERHPAFAPDGKSVVYAAGEDVHTRQLYLRNLVSGDTTQLTNLPGDNGAPAWAYDGKTIAFINYRPGEPCRIMRLTVATRGSSELARCRFAERSWLSWSPGSDALYFVDPARAGGDDRIMLLELASGLRTPMTNPISTGLEEMSPAASPDGRWLAFARRISDHDIAIAVRDLRVGTERTLLRGNYGGTVAWSSDSNSLFGITSSGGESVLWNVPLAGGKPARVTSDPLPFGRVASGPSGLLAVEVTLHHTNIASTTADGTPAGIDPVKDRDGTAAFAPDGTLIWDCDRSGRPELWTKAPGGVAKKLANLNTPILYGVRLSPDGSRLAFVSGASGEPAIRITNRAAVDIATIRFDGSQIGVPTWSSDGNGILFAARDARGWRIWRADVANPTAIRPVSEYGWTSIRSYNGVLYGERAGTAGVWQIDGATRRLTPAPPLEDDYSAIHWTIFHGDIVYLENPFAERPRIVARSLSGGPARLIAYVPRYAYEAGFALNPRTENVVYTMVGSSESDIELLHLSR